MAWIFIVNEVLTVLTIRHEPSQNSKDREKAMIENPIRLSLLLFLFTILAIYLLYSSDDRALGPAIEFDLFLFSLIAVVQQSVIGFSDLFRS